MKLIEADWSFTCVYISLHVFEWHKFGQRSIAINALHSIAYKLFKIIDCIRFIFYIEGIWTKVNLFEKYRRKTVIKNNFYLHFSAFFKMFMSEVGFKANSNHLLYSTWLKATQCNVTQFPTVKHRKTNSSLILLDFIRFYWILSIIELIGINQFSYNSISCYSELFKLL